uniref:Uncharacterized protein n=1 Tax=Pristionchus pacificus TaxID=54126 RepID=A0A2A6CTG9_PRIPA|eukprot:PDM81408.1 hypothetical protein PRIPAC_35284 [Pristionchus pacificus]
MVAAVSPSASAHQSATHLLRHMQQKVPKMQMTMERRMSSREVLQAAVLVEISAAGEIVELSGMRARLTDKRDRAVLDRKN